MERYRNILEHFGIRNQMKKLNEECFELLEAIDNYEDSKLYGEESDKHLDVFRDHIVEEMADMLTLLTQFIVKYNVIAPEIDNIMDLKLERTEKRISEGYYDKKVD